MIYYIIRDTGEEIFMKSMPEHQGNHQNHIRNSVKF